MECSVIPARVIATCFALVSFVAAIVVGAHAGNDVGVIIVRATGTMVVCWFVGRGFGALVQRVVDEHIQQYRDAHPIPEEHDMEKTLEAPAQELAGGDSEPSDGAASSVEGSTPVGAGVS